MPSAPVYSIDVEAVATGLGHNDRAVAQISLVDMNEQARSKVPENGMQARERES